MSSWPMTRSFVCFVAKTSQDARLFKRAGFNRLLLIRHYKKKLGFCNKQEGGGRKGGGRKQRGGEVTDPLRGGHSVARGN